LAQIRARRRVVEMKMSRSSIINIQQEWKRGILLRKRMRRTTIGRVTKMLREKKKTRPLRCRGRFEGSKEGL